MTACEYLKLIDRVIDEGDYKPTFESLCRHKTPDWFTLRKFGIFVHWGVYSVPAFGSEWYARTMYDPCTAEYAHHRATYGSQSDFGYKDFIPLFKAQRFCPDEWAALFRQAGAGYVVPVAEHHDGFAMYKTAFNRWNAAEMGPRRDVLAELRAACEKEGLVFCASSHRAEHYFYMNTGKIENSDVCDARFADFYGPAYCCEELRSERVHVSTADPLSVGASEQWLDDWLVRTCEMIDVCRPKLIYFDWWIHNRCFKPYLKRLAAYYYNRALEWGVQVTICYKHEAFPPLAATPDIERGALTGISPVPWQADTAIGRDSWGYTANNDFKGAQQIICDLVDIVSKNGNLLLNVGPRADGAITAEETRVLRDIGAWLSLNGEGIYGTAAWKTFGEGGVNAEEGAFKDREQKPYTNRDFRFTYKNGCVYAFWMKPDAGRASIKSLALQGKHDLIVKNVSRLGAGGVKYERTRDALVIETLGEVCPDAPVCFKIELE